MTKAIIIFGASGFIGRHLATALAARGEHIIALTRTGAKHTLPGVETHTGQFVRAEDFSHLLPRARAVIHVASCSTPGHTAGKPLEELDSNLRPTLALLAALQATPTCELLYISSGGTLYGDTQGRPAQEHDPIRPHSYYGAAKAAAEHFIHAGAMQYGFAATLLRPSNLYGPGQGARNGFGIIPTAFNHICSGTPLTLWGDGSAVRDYLYIDDFVKLCLAVIGRQMPSGLRTFNASSGNPASINALFETIRNITNRPLNVTHKPKRSVDLSRIEIDPTAATLEYNWTPKTALREGLEFTWACWQKEQ